MLRFKNIKQLYSSIKLLDRYLKPFKVLEVIGHHRQVYRLELLSLYKIYNIFYINLLKL